LGRWLSAIAAGKAAGATRPHGKVSICASVSTKVAGQDKEDALYKREPKPSILDLRDQSLLASKVHYLLKENRDKNGQLEMLWEIVSTLLNIAVCDYCHEEWFTIEPRIPGPRGDVRGLLVAGGACCAKCIDRLYEQSTEFEEEEVDAMYHDLAQWFLRHRGNRNMTIFRDDEYMEHLMRQLAP
jgi:hypothetical protein